MPPKRFDVIATNRFRKDFKKLDYKTQEQVLIALEALGEDPKRGKPLSHDLKGLWSYRVHKCRLIYRILKDVIIAEHVGFRRDVYPPTQKTTGFARG